MKMNKKNVWTYHFRYYDLFQNNFSRYLGIIKIHLKELKNYNYVLDSGAGSGNLTLELLKQKHLIFAVDNNKLSLKILKNKCKKYSKNLKVKIMDVQKLSFRNNKFDAVSSMFLIPFVEDNEKYFKEVYRILKPNGKFSLSAWAPIKNSWKGVVVELGKELKKKGFFPKHQREYEYILKTSKINVKSVLKGPKIEKLKKMLKEAGFKKIKTVKNPYGKYAYFIVCEK